MAINSTGLSMPGIAPAPKKTPTLLTGGATSSMTKLSLPSFPSSGRITNTNLTAGINSINPSGQPTISNFRPSAPPVSPITRTPAPAFGSAPASSSRSTQTPLGAGKYDSTYDFKPGEAPEAYNARIATYNASKQDAGTFAPSDAMGSRPATLSSGSVVSTDGDGNITSPSSFNIDVSGPVTSDVFSSTLSRGDLTTARKTYADYVLGLAEATQYSPQYIQALENVQKAQAKDAELQSNFYTGRAPGDTVDYAQGSTARARSLNSLDALGAQQALQVQELVRSGNIDAAKALVAASQPTGVSPGSSLISPIDGSTTFGGTGAYSDFQAQQTYFNLAQSYPDANIPPYDPALPAQTNYQIAQSLVSRSPSFSSKYTNIQQLAGGEVVAYNKNTGQMEYIQSALDASSTNADAASLKEAQGYADNVQRAINTADANFTVLANLMRETGINDTGSPITNQLQNKFQRGVIGSGKISAFNTVITSLRAEYAQVLSRGGGVTDTVRKEANDLIPADISLTELMKVKSVIHAEGANVIAQAQAQVQAIQGRLTQPTYSGGGSGGLYDF